MASKNAGCISVAGWHIDLTTGELRQGDQIQRLGPKTTAVLACLAERAGEVISKEDLLASVWPDVAVTDYVLWSCISDLRRALGTRTRSSRTLETLPRRGYRLTADVVVHHAADDADDAEGESQAGRGPELLPGRERPLIEDRVQEDIAVASRLWSLTVLAVAAGAGFWLATRTCARNSRECSARAGE